MIYPMIDIHCHILPGIDDGPESIGEALEMCRAAASDGIKTIVATPHFRPGSNEFTGPKILEAAGTLQSAVMNDGIDIRILPGAEVAVSPEMPSYLTARKHLTINHNGRYFLTEFSSLSVPPNWDNFLLSFLVSGLVPIIAHPERNAWFAAHPDALSHVVERGVMVQITAMSVTGHLGPEARDFSVHLLKRGLVHMIASDGHSSDSRPPVLSGAMDLVSDLLGEERARAMVTSVPEAVIEGRDVPVFAAPAYAPPKRGIRRWFGRRA